jgi:hypothetical protein
MCALTWAGCQGPGSPDRADAMVWAMTELFDKARAEPRIRRSRVRHVFFRACPDADILLKASG